MIRRILVSGALALLGLSTAARAAVSYRYVTDQSTYYVTPGGSVQVPIFLQEFLSGGSTSVIASDQGLEGAGAAVSRFGAVPSDPAVVQGFAFNTADFGGATFFSANPAGSSANFAETADNLAVTGPVGTAVPGGNLEFLGTLSIQAGAQLLPGQSTQFSLGKRFGSGNTITFGNFYDLDQTSTNPAYTGVGTTTSTFTVTTPEPAAAGLLMTCGALLSALRFRRRDRARARTN